MKKQKIKNRDNFYGEAIFNIATYNTSRNYSISERSSKRAGSSMLVLMEYVHNVGQKKK